MLVRLGYVAIAKTIDEISYNHTITYTALQKLPTTERQIKLDTIMKENLNNLKKVLQYNVQNKISFFRFSHNMVPLATHPDVTFDYITPYQKKWSAIGKYIKNHHLRIDSHPDQFCVLNSIEEKTIKNSIKMLSYQYELYQAMELEGHTVIHIGSSKPTKEEALKRFAETFQKLPSAISSMILLENDDKTFTVAETLSICEQLQIPMVLDYHHYYCNPGKDHLEELLPRIIATWKGMSLPVKMHFSSPKSKKEKRAHHETIDVHTFIKFLELLKPYLNEVDIMLECKGKDEALFRLSRQLKFYTNYHFLNNSTFIIKN